MTMSSLAVSASRFFTCRGCNVLRSQFIVSPRLRYLSSQQQGGSEGEDGIQHPEQYEEVPIPTPKVRTNETLKVKKARLVYQSRKRGMLENGILLSTFAARYLDKLTEPQLDVYDTLINKPSNDWEIYYWAIGNKPTPEEYDTEVMDMLKEHAKNKEMEQRLTQPNLY